MRLHVTLTPAPVQNSSLMRGLTQSTTDVNRPIRTGLHFTWDSRLVWIRPTARFIRWKYISITILGFSLTAWSMPRGESYPEDLNA